MIPKTKHAHTNFIMVRPFVEAARAAGGYKKFKSGGYMDLVVEDLCINDHDGNRVFSITHYGEQNGDLMRDPDVTFSYDTKNERIIPRTYQNDYMGMYQEVFKTIDGRLCYSYSMITGIDSMLWIWLKNLQAQGFTAA